jgi:hypothetical protein
MATAGNLPPLPGRAADRHKYSLIRIFLPVQAAGWHICLDLAERNLAGDPVGRIVADQAMAHGWQRLSDGYAAALEKP